MSWVRVLRNFTLEPIAPYLRDELAGSGGAPELRFGGLTTARQELLALDEEESPALTVLAQSLEMRSPSYGHADWDGERAHDDVVGLARLAVERVRGTLVLNTVLPPLHPEHGFGAPGDGDEAAARVAAINADLRRLRDGDPARVVLCDWERYARRVGEAGTYDYRFWYSGMAPYAPPFLRLYAAEVAQLLRLQRGAVRKCVVVDADNTLWGGVVGEDGIDGIRLDPTEAPGAIYHQFQRSLLDLHARGVLLLLASKNNEADVLEVLERHPATLLRRQHLAAWRINWNPKIQSLREFARELGLGLDSFVLVDDSPMERDLVRQALPEVAVLDFPERLGELPSLLARSGLFATPAVTAEDRGRAASYGDNRERERLRGGVESLDDYLASLATRVRIGWAEERDLPRVAQLIQKTNQFNLTTRRHAPADVERFFASPEWGIVTMRVADRFGDLGLTGVLIARREGAGAAIDSLLVSCRALGRDAEHVLVAEAVARLAERWPIVEIRSEFVRSARNQQVADFYPRCGFAVVEPGEERATYRATDLAAVVAANRRAHVTVEEMGES